MEAGDLHGIVTHALSRSPARSEAPPRAAMMSPGAAARDPARAAARGQLQQQPQPSQPQGLGLADGTLAVQAHTFALAAETASRQSRFREAASRHNSAQELFAAALQADSWQHDPATAEALSMLATYHEKKFKEMRRLGRSRDSVATASAGASPASPASPGTAGTPAASRSSARQASAADRSPGSSSSTTSSSSSSQWTPPRSTKPQDLFKEVERQFDKLQDVMVPGLRARADGGPEDAASAALPPGASPAGAPLRRQSGAARAGETVPPDDGAMREKVRLLSAENARLSRELAKLRRQIQQKKDGPSEVELLREEFHKQFGVLKLSMQHFKLSYAEGDLDGRRKLLEERIAGLHQQKSDLEKGVLKERKLHKRAVQEASKHARHWEARVQDQERIIALLKKQLHDAGIAPRAT